MKFTVSMKDPDALINDINDAVKADVADIQGLDEAERESVCEHRIESVTQIASKWFEYGEYLRVEIDTDAGTCVVLPVRA